MKIVTIEQVRDHVRADGDDDTQLEHYATAAERQFERLAHRAIFKDQAEMDAAQALLDDAITAAWDRYEAEIAVADTLPKGARRSNAQTRARVALRRTLDEQELISNGMVANEDVQVAILILTGHYYRNREEVVSGQGAAAVQLPMAAEDIAYRYRWIGYDAP